MAETMASGTYEERPKTNWFLWVAAGFFVIMILAIWELPNGTMKWAWMGIAVLNLTANTIQINNTRMTRYVLWKRGLSIYIGKTREALIRFDKALMFRPFKSTKDAKEDMAAFGVKGSLRSYPIFGSRRRWLVIFEREDGTVQGLVFDPTPGLEAMFRERLIEVDQSQSEAIAGDEAQTQEDLAPLANGGEPPAAAEEEEWEEDELQDEAADKADTAGTQPAKERKDEDLPR